MNFHDAWWFLHKHPAFVYKGVKELLLSMKLEFKLLDDECSGFKKQLSIDIVKVNPTTNTIDDNDSLNTKTRVWLECGPLEFPNGINLEFISEREMYYTGVDTIDHDLDCGGDTFEEAIIKLANLVKENYGSCTSVDCKVHKYNNGTFSYGHGEFKDQSWQHPCDVCNINKQPRKLLKLQCEELLEKYNNLKASDN